MTRTPPTDERRMKLQQETLLQMRAARQTIDPDVLKKARDAILGAQAAPDEEKVDRVRTLSIVREYLQLTKDNPRLRDEIRAMLAKLK